MARGDDIEGFYVLKSAFSKVANNGKPFLNLTLSDRTGAVDATVSYTHLGHHRRGKHGAGEVGAGNDIAEPVLRAELFGRGDHVLIGVLPRTQIGRAHV